MRKARSKKFALLLVLTMLATMFVGVGTASAAYEYANISSTYTYVDDGEDNEDAGKITITMGDDYAAGDVTDVYAEITLPDGVEFSDTGDLDLDNGTSDFELIGADAEGVDSVLLKATAVPAADATLIVDAIEIDIDSDVSGSIVAEVRVWAVDADSTIWDETDDATIAKVASGDVTVTAKSAKALSVGSDKKAAKITIKESSPGALTAGAAADTDNDIQLIIKASGVKWDTTNMTAADIVASGVTVSDPDFPGDSDKTLHLDVLTGTTSIDGKIEITPSLTVQPGASGDVVIQVKGDDIDTVEFTVGTIGETDVAITVEKETKDKVYLGGVATFDDVKVTLDPDIQLDDGDYFTITLPDGLKFQDKDAADNDVDACDSSSGNVTFTDLYNDDQSAWLSIDVDETDDVELTNFRVKADYDAPVGDLEVTFDGAVVGTCQIGVVAAPFEITTTAVNLPVSGSDVEGNTITITETADGAIKASDNDEDKDDYEAQWLDIQLPMGVNFAGIPDVDVVDGDLDLGDITLSDDNDTLYIKIDEASNVASVIEITDIEYDIDNRAADGDVVAKVGKDYNLVSSNPIAKLTIGKVVSEATVPASAFVIGSTTYTVDGVEATMDVAPFISGDRTYMPIRYVAYALGITDANILWDQASQTVTLMKGDKVVQLTVGSTQLLINGAAITMDVAPMNVDPGRVCLPIRFVAQAFGAEVSWDAATQTVTIE